MRSERSPKTLLATAVVVALTLGACSETRDNQAASSSTMPATTAGSPRPTSPTDRVTADSSSAPARAGKATSGTTTSGNAATGTSATQMPSGMPSGNNATERATSAAGDAALTAKVKAALMAEPGIDSLQLDVDTSNGRVTLSGEVDNAQNRQRVLQVARSVDGVDAVVDRLSVKR